MLSVICPIYNEEKYIAKCIDSILTQDYPKDDLEIIFVDGMSTDNTRTIVAEYSEKHPFIRMIDNPDRIVPYAMNRGIRASKGEIIMRLDAHTTYASNYFSVLVRSLDELHADNVGAACRTDVLNKTPKALAIKEVLCNRFGVGNATFRLGVDKVVEADTVPFGCWKRECFEKYGMFDERLTRNQDIELNKRILRAGGKIYLVPDTYCVYMARESYRALAKNNYGNGKWNIWTVYYTGQLGSLSLRHFIPLLFVLSLIVPLLADILYWPLALISLLSLVSYTSLIGAISAKLSISKKLNFMYLLFSFIVLHLSYGIGSLIGILCLPFLSKKK